MKRIVAIGLIFIVIGAYIPTDELLRLPYLIQHYHENKTLHPGDSPTIFLYKHYVLNQKAESEKDKKSDAQLPFKSDKRFHSHIDPFICENKTEMVLNQLVLKMQFPFKETRSYSAFRDIWQPPRLG